MAGAGVQPDTKAGNRRCSRATGCLLLLLALLVCASNYLWIRADSRPPNSDTGHHFAKSHAYYEFLTASEPLPVRIGRCYTYPTVFPPLPYLAAAVAYRLNGAYAGHAFLIGMLLFWPVLIWYTYRLGDRVWSRETGVLAALVASTAPMLIIISRKFFDEFPLAALLAVSFYYLVACEGFSRRREGLLCGLSFGAALLIKWTALVYLGGALVVGIAESIRRSFGSHRLVRAGIVLYSALQALVLVQTNVRGVKADTLPAEVFAVMGRTVLCGAAVILVAVLLEWSYEQQSPRPWLVMLQSAAVAWVIAAPWYLMHRAALLGYFPNIGFIAGGVEGDPSPQSLSGRLYYLWAIQGTQLQPLFWMLAMGVLYAAVATLRGQGRAAPLLFAVLGFYVLASALTNKEARYFVPLTPVLACLTVCWLPLLGRWRWLVLVPLGAVCMAQLWGWTFTGRLEARLRPYYLASDNVAASALSLPGLQHPPAELQWSDLVHSQFFPILGSRPVAAGWDDRTILRERGP